MARGLEPGKSVRTAEGLEEPAMAKQDKDTLYVIAAAYDEVDAAVADYEAVNGRPHWIPPSWLDPEQTPRRNDLHD
jgi:hypothetical protein